MLLLVDLKTLTAQNRPPTRGLERQDRFDAALRADGTRLGPAEAYKLRATGWNVLAQALSPARLAVLGVVAKLLIEEEELFAGAEDELVVAIGTGQKSIYEFHIGSPSHFEPGHCVRGY